MPVGVSGPRQQTPRKLPRAGRSLFFDRQHQLGTSFACFLMLTIVTNVVTSHLENARETALTDRALSRKDVG